MTLREWRDHYATLGFATVPLVHHGKRPLRRRWLERGDEQWVGAPGGSNIGILTGSRSGGLVVLDFDTMDGPERVLGMTPNQLAVLTIVVRTARGWHVYSRGEHKSCTLVEGVDVRGDGGMVVAPPSVHPSGHVYEFLAPSRGLVPLDAVLPIDLGRSDGEPPLGRESDALTDGRRDPLVAAAGAWVEMQAPKLQEAWKRLCQPSSLSFDASKADFAVARCLWEAGWPAEDVARLLLRLPGSRARERGSAYARLTAERAAAIRRQR